jgi:long-chain fatty acid transport protein
VRHRLAVLTLSAALLAAPPVAWASGYALPNTNSRDLSMSASAVAAQRDSGAVFTLPAALARLDGLSVSVGAGAVSVYNTWTDPTPGATLPPYTGSPLAPVPALPPEPGSQSLKANLTIWPQVSVAWGGKVPFLGDRGVGVGLSFEPYGGARVPWADDWAGRYRITDVDRRVYSAMGSVAIEVIPQIRLGGGALFYYTEEKFVQHLWMEPFGGAPLAPSAPGFPDASASLRLTGHAWSWDASIEGEPVKDWPLTLAVDYKHQGVQNLTGNTSISGVAPLFSGPLPPTLSQLLPLQAIVQSTSASSQLTIPNELNVGAAFRPAKPWLVTFTYTWDRWSVYQSDTFVGDVPGAVITVPRNYNDGHTFRAGVEWAATRNLELRAGFQRDISGLTTSTYSPTLPDGSSWGGSLGAGWKFGQGFSVSAAVFYANVDKVTSTNNGPEPGFYGAAFATPSNPLGALPVPLPDTTFRGSYEPSALIYSLAVGWTPGAHTGD